MSDLPDKEDDKVVAVSFLTAEEVKNVGTGLKRLYPLPDDDSFDDLLKALDRASGAETGKATPAWPWRRRRPS